MSGWGCPHEIAGVCQRLKGRMCDPGTRGCVLHGRFVFSNPSKNRPRTAGSSAADEAAADASGVARAAKLGDAEG